MKVQGNREFKFSRVITAIIFFLLMILIFLIAIIAINSWVDQKNSEAVINIKLDVVSAIEINKTRV